MFKSTFNLYKLGLCNLMFPFLGVILVFLFIYLFLWFVDPFLVFFQFMSKLILFIDI